MKDLYEAYIPMRMGKRETYATFESFVRMYFAADVAGDDLGIAIDTASDMEQETIVTVVP